MKRHWKNSAGLLGGVLALTLIGCESTEELADGAEDAAEEMADGVEDAADEFEDMVDG